ncbi:MAG: EamA family transporter [Solirubrobacteraceae bacterium]
MTGSAALAVLAALLYGLSDFWTGLASRALRVASASRLNYSVAAVVMLLALACTGGAWSTAAILWGSAAGVFALIGLLAFYAAMATGPMSVASPLIAVLESTVPVAVALTIGEHLVWWAWLAIAAAIAAGVLLAADRTRTSMRISRRTVLLAIIAGGTLGLSVVALNAAPKAARFIPGVCETLVGLIALLAVSVVSYARGQTRSRPAKSETVNNRDPGQPRHGALLAAIGGALLGAANTALILALHSGNLAIVGVLVSLYPVATIFLARLVLKERLTLVQAAGAILALFAAAALALT